MKKKTYAEVVKVIEVESASGCKVVTPSSEYKNTHQRITLKCSCGNLFDVSYHIFTTKHKHTCNSCSRRNVSLVQKLDGQRVYQDFINAGFIPQFNPQDYKNARTRLPYLCERHVDKGVQYVTHTNLIGMKGCTFCRWDKTGSINRLTGDEVYRRFVERGFAPLFSPDDYVGARQPLPFICTKHGHQETTYANLCSGYGCRVCGREVVNDARRVDGEVVINLFKDLGMIPLFKSEEYVSNTQKLPFICTKHEDKGIQYVDYASMRRRNRCYFCGMKRITGHNHYNFKGGISPLHNYMREKIGEWKIKVATECNHRCVLTGKRHYEIHHLRSFNILLKETLDELNMPLLQEVADYSAMDLQNITDMLLKKHSNVGGVCLAKDVHESFHKWAGRGDNTPEQFYEFQQGWLAGEFQQQVGD